MFVDDVGSRIKKAREDANLSQKQLAEKVGVTEKTLRSWEKGETDPNIGKAREISTVCGVRLHWIIDGDDGKKLPCVGDAGQKINISLLQDSESKQNPLHINKKSKETITINFYHDTTAAAGYGCINGDELPEPLEISRSFLSNILGLKVFKNLDIIGVQGDSMEPFISNGEYVIVERTDEARNNEIVIANVNGEVYVKRLLRDPFQKWVKLISTNKSYEDIMLKDDELQYINIIGVVRAKFRPF